MNPEVLAISIPIVAIVMGIGIGMLALWLDYRKKRDIFELHHKERMAAIEKGMEVPPLPAELFSDYRKRRTPADSLRRGLVLLPLGIAIVIALYMTPGAGAKAAYWGLVPAALGLGNLIFYYVEGRKAPTDADADKRGR
jgi:hypothetical protein